MKKKISMLLVLVLVVCLWTGCGNTSGSSEAEAASVSSAAASSETISDAAETSEAATETEEQTSIPQENSENEASVSEDAAGAAGQETETEETEQALYVYELPIYEEQVELSYYFSFPSFFLNFCDPQEDSLYFNTISERTGIHINLVLATGEVANEQFGLMMASDDIPDLIYGFTTLYTEGVDHAVDNGVIVDINQYMEYAPCYDYWTSDEDINRSISSSNGYIGGFYTIYDKGVYNSGMMVRQDWLDTLGLEIPETIDEMHNVLTMFRDEMGADSALWIGSTGLASDISGAFNVDVSYNVSTMDTSYPFYVIDGQVRFGMIADEFLDYLTTMHKWYDEGLIDRDFYSATTSTTSEAGQQHVLSGRTGIWSGGCEDSLAYPETTEEYGIVVKAMRDPVLVKGDINHFGINTARVASNCVSISADSAEVVAAVQWMDYQYSDEGSELNNWGVEGISFYYDETGRKVKDDVITNGIGDTPAVVINALYTGGFQPSVKTLEATQASYNDTQIEMMEIWAEAADGAYLYPKGASMTAEETETFSNIVFDINTYVQENVPKFITGEKALDTFEEFRDTINSMGAAELVSIKQASYDRYMK